MMCAPPKKNNMIPKRKPSILYTKIMEKLQGTHDVIQTSKVQGNCFTFYNDSHSGMYQPKVQPGDSSLQVQIILHHTHEKKHVSQRLQTYEHFFIHVSVSKLTIHLCFPIWYSCPQTQQGKNGTTQFRLGAMHQIDHAFVHDCDEIYGVAMPKDLSPDADQSAKLMIRRS